MLKILLLLLLFIFINFTNSKSKFIYGKIFDLNTNETLAGVRIISDCDTVYSDFDGNFEIKCLSDTINLQFNLISYNSNNLEIIFMNKNYLIKKLKKVCI